MAYRVKALSWANRVHSWEGPHDQESSDVSTFGQWPEMPGGPCSLRATDKTFAPRGFNDSLIFA